MEPEFNPSTNPFSDWVFREPRQPHASVAGLNDHALNKLLAQFRRLQPDADPAAHGKPAAPRRILSEPAQLVVSPQPGYGKSHLIGRLFAALEGQGTLIYVTPFQSTSLCWQSILLRTVQELTFPDRAPPAAPETPAAEPPSQLDAFAHGVLAHLVAGLIEAGRVEHPDPAGAAAWLREHPLEAFALCDPGNPWAQWLRAFFEQSYPEMEAALRRAGLNLHSPGWLKVLFRYAASDPGDDVRALCLAWLGGQSLESSEAAPLGLRAGELTPAELPEQINELCWRRLMDFCQLAAFYRPFVFCFDQTEAYGHSADLARCFGMVVAQIHLLAPNQMMVVTANQQPWMEKVAPHMETADKDRFVPLALDGLNRAQAEELVRLRCRDGHVPDAQVNAFLGGDWLQGKLPTERNRMGTRQFLQLCSTRWQQSEGWWHGAASAAATENDVSAGPTLEELLDRYAADFSRKRKQMLYNPDAFRWLVEDLARDRPVWSVAVNTASQRGYLLPIVWSAPGQAKGSGAAKIFIGFEPGDNWKRWRAILQEARACCLSSPSSPPLDRPGDVQAKAVFFRTAEQPPIPGTRWAIAAEVEAAKASFLDLVELDRNSTAELYAARAMYLDAVAGDLSFKAEDVLDFLVGELEPFWQRIEEEVPGGGAAA